MTTPKDAAAEIAMIERRDLHRGFRTYEALTFRTEGQTHRREVLRIGRVAAVLPYDPERDVLVLLRQFRMGAHLATGDGDMVEIVAGLAESDEDLKETARRETLEEIGTAALDLTFLFDFLPTPGFCDEHAFLFCARVSSKDLPLSAGLASEKETTRPFIVSAEEAARMVASPGGVRNGYTRLALFWFALNREAIRASWTA